MLNLSCVRLMVLNSSRIDVVRFFTDEKRCVSSYGNQALETYYSTLSMRLDVDNDCFESKNILSSVLLTE